MRSEVVIPGHDAVEDHARIWKSAWLRGLWDHTAGVGGVGCAQVGVHNILQYEVSLAPVRWGY